jgi:F0F1-type ATP synthase assembly protein I
LIVTVATALAAWPFAGSGGAVSAALAGSINLVAGLAFYAVASLGGLSSAGATVERAMRAEASKILMIIAALWTVLSTFKGIVFVPFFAAFALTALLPSVALLVRDDPADRSTTDKTT